MVDLKGKPFLLDDEAIEWVESIKKSMSLSDKIGQLFCFCSRVGTDKELDEMLSVANPGGIMIRPMPLKTVIEYNKVLNERVEIPLLIAANLEKGGNGIISDKGTLFASPLEAAAAGEDAVKMAEILGTICGKEAAAVGANWAFAPIIDIDFNYRNPITNTRTFGSNPERVKNMGAAYVSAVQKHGVAASIKHFPGDGCDDRDQHLVTSINDLSCEEWDETFGKIYKASIDAGALTLMVGHIMQPAYQKALNPDLKDEELMPATLSVELMQGLLRERLGFNGLIVTDATTMCGYAIPMERSKAVPASIERGADMFLFTKNIKEDFEFMLEGYENGLLSEKRVDEAVTRILAVKAALGLHKGKKAISLENAEKIVGCEEHHKLARECAKKSITLVKSEKGVLPVSPEKYKKVLFYPIESEAGVVYGVKSGVCNHFKELLIKAGFDVETFETYAGLEGNMQGYGEFVEKYDLLIYLANMSTKSNQTTVRIEWMQPMGSNVPIYINSVPTIFISVENPYHLQDVPRVKTFINAYSSHDEVLNELIEKLLGKSPFEGESPVDAFCGRWDTKL